MVMVKICPSCGAHNPPSESLCTVCMASIVGIKPVDAEELEYPETDQAEDRAGDPEACEARDDGPDEHDSSATLLEQDRRLTLVFSDSGRTLTVRPGDILGREEVGRSEFADRPTVSRRHARIVCDGGRLAIEDLRSKNGTWVNGRRLEEGKPCPLRRGDILCLSRSCELSVRE